MDEGIISLWNDEMVITTEKYEDFTIVYIDESEKGETLTYGDRDTAALLDSIVSAIENGDSLFISNRDEFTCVLLILEEDTSDR